MFLDRTLSSEESDCWNAFWNNLHADNYAGAYEALETQEFPEALYLLGLVCDLETGRNPKFDPQKAFDYLRRATEAGYEPAKVALAKKYLERLDDNTAIETAATYLEGAADRHALELTKSPLWPSLRQLVLTLSEEQEKVFQPHGGRRECFAHWGEYYCENIRAMSLHAALSSNEPDEVRFRKALTHLSPRKDWQSPEGLNGLIDFMIQEGNPYSTPERIALLSAARKEYLVRERIGDMPYEELLHSTYSHGPVYNRLNDYGVPILGDWLQPGEDPAPHLRAYGVQAHAFVPAPGVVAVTGITGNADGSIKFNTVAKSDRPALLLQEDFRLVMALVFCDQQVPGFDLQNIDTEMGVTLSHKVWEPAWIGHTALGDTLYLTDRLLGDLAFNDRCLIERVPDEHAHDPRIPQIADDFLTALDAVKNMPKAPHSIAAGFRLHQHHLADNEIITRQEDGAVHVDILEGNPRIRGWAYRENSKPKEESDINDGQYMQGACANMLTERYNELALLLPVYERYRQLLAMYTALQKLKDTGFQLKPELQAELDQFVAAYEQSPSLNERARTVNFTHVMV